MSNRKTFVMHFVWNIVYFRASFVPTELISIFMQFLGFLLKLFVTRLCCDLSVPNEETHALQVPYDITKSQGLVYDLTSFLRVIFSNPKTFVMYFVWSHLLQSIICSYIVDFHLSCSF